MLLLSLFSVGAFTTASKPSGKCFNMHRRKANTNVSQEGGGRQRTLMGSWGNKAGGAAIPLPAVLDSYQVTGALSGAARSSGHFSCASQHASQLACRADRLAC